MQPGPELDHKIATELLRYAVISSSGSKHRVFNTQTRLEQDLPAFSTNLDEAYKIIQEMTKRGFNHMLGTKPFKGELKPYAAFFIPPREPLIVFGKTAEHSICLAALVAIDNIKVTAPVIKSSAEIIQFPGSKPKDK